jgi:O-antigen ligase
LIVGQLEELLERLSVFGPSTAQIAAFTLFLFLFAMLTRLPNFLGSELAGNVKERRAVCIAGFTIWVLSLSGLMALLGFENAMLAFELSLLIVLSLLNPALAVSSWLFLLILRPWEAVKDNSRLAILPRLFFCIVLMSFCLSLLRKPAQQLRFERTQIYLLALGAWLFLTTFLAPDVAFQQSVFIDHYVTAIIVVILLFQAIVDLKSFEIVKSALIWSVFGLVCLAALHTYLQGLERLEGEGMLANSNDIAALVVLVFPLAFGYVLKDYRKISAWLAIGVLSPIFLYAIWRAQSRAAFIALAAMAISYAALRPRTLRTGVTLGLLVVGFAAAMPSYLARQSSDLEESSSNRLGYVKAGLQMAIRHPGFGVGFGQYPRQYKNYGVDGFSEFGERTAHNSWILILAEAGFPAFLLFAYLYFKAAQRAWRLRWQAPELMMCMIGYGICMSFISHTYTLYPYLVIALVMSYPFVEPPIPNQEGAIA